jgi:hypothetical protein
MATTGPAAGGQNCDGALFTGEAPIGTRPAGPAVARAASGSGRQIYSKGNAAGSCSGQATARSSTP